METLVSCMIVIWENYHEQFQAWRKEEGDTNDICYHSLSFNENWLKMVFYSTWIAEYFGQK